MCEIAPGVYAGSRLSTAVRQRIWAVVEDWFVLSDDAYVVMTWPARDKPCGQDLLTIGIPRKALVEVDGIVLTGRLDDGGLDCSLTIE